MRNITNTAFAYIDRAKINNIRFSYSTLKLFSLYLLKVQKSKADVFYLKY